MGQKVPTPCSNYSDGTVRPQILRAGTDMHQEISLLHHIFHRAIPETPLTHIEIDCHIDRLTSRNKHLLEALELDVRHNDTRDEILYIDLHNFFTIPLSSISDAHCCCDLFIGRYFRLAEAHVGVGEVRIRQPVTKLVERLRVVENVLVAKLQGAIWPNLAGFGVAPGVEVVVVDGQCTDVIGEGDGQLAGGIDITEEHIGECMAALLARVELLDESCGVLTDPGLGDRLARAVDDDGGFAGGDDSLDEWAHGAYQVERCHIDVFSGCSVETSP